MVRYVISSPPDQVQPKYMERFYAKPGDVLDLQQPTLFDVETRKQTNVDNTLFPDPFGLSQLQWRRDSRAFTVRVQPTRPPALPRHRSQCDHGQRALVDRRTGDHLH
jgi:hypothetical protein